jgi:hypothetical protein
MEIQHAGESLLAHLAERDGYFASPARNRQISNRAQLQSEG